MGGNRTKTKETIRDRERERNTKRITKKGGGDAGGKGATMNENDFGESMLVSHDRLLSSA